MKPMNLAIEADEELDALVDPDELARLPTPGQGRQAQRRFATHLLERAPHSILGRLMSARLEDDTTEQLRLLDEGVRLGMLRWAPELLQLESEPRWPQHAPARLFLTCIIAYGTALGENGMYDQASRCFGLLRRLDPQDELGAQRTARLSGWLRDEPITVLADAYDFRASVILS